MDDKNLVTEILENIPSDIKEETLSSAVSLMKILFKDPLIEIGNMFSERIKAKRYATMINIIAEAHQKLLKSGISPSEPSLKVILPLLENSSLEEDIKLKDKWSSLLKNSLDGNKISDPHIAYINILRELTPLEGLILDFLFNYFEGDRFDVFHAAHLLEKEFSITSDVTYIFLDNFQRMNLVDSTLDRELYSYLKDSKYEINNHREDYFVSTEIVNRKMFDVEGTEMAFTYLCKGFMFACAS